MHDNNNKKSIFANIKPYSDGFKFTQGSGVISSLSETAIYADLPD